MLRSICRPILKPALRSALLSDDAPTPAYDLNFMGGMPAGLTYTNSSTERVYWDSTGTRRSAVANEPIFETLNGVAMGMRWEMEARTNLATNSEAAAATWNVSNVSDAGTPIAGFSQSLQFGDNSALRYAYKPIVVTSGTVYTVSVFVQMDDGNAPVVGTTSTAGDFGIISDNSLNTVAPTVQRIAGNIYRVSSAKAATINGTRSNGVIKYTGQSARTFRIAGIQVEAAASASSYIPTAGSAVTRQPDVLTASSISPWYNASEGTVVFDGLHTATDAAARGHYVFNDGTNTNRIISAKLIDNAFSGVIVATATQMSQSLGTVSADAVFRTVMAYKANNSNYAANGTLGTTDTSVTIPTITALTFGKDRTTASGYFMGYARRFSYYNTRLPDTIIQGLSRV